MLGTSLSLRGVHSDPILLETSSNSAQRRVLGIKFRSNKVFDAYWAVHF